MRANCQSMASSTVVLASILLLPAGPAGAQNDDQTAVEGETTVPVEIVLETVNGEVRCGPPQVRLPVQDEVEIRFINRSELPIMFAAPDFFASATVFETGGFALDAATGSFLAAPESTVDVRVRTPSADEYGYVCHEPGDAPTPSSSGYLVVGSLDRDAVRIPPRPDQQEHRLQTE